MPYVRQLKRPDDVGDERSGRWAATYRDATGRRHTRTFLREKPAKLWALGKEDEVRRGAHTDPSGGRKTVRAYSELWVAGRQVRPSTGEVTRSRLDGYVLPRFGRQALAEMSRPAVRAWVGQLLTSGGKKGAPLAPSTVKGVLGILSAMMAQAVDDGLIVANPCARISVPAPPPSDRVFLDEKQIGALIGALPVEWRPWGLLMAYTGLRWGEAAGLRVRRLDLLRRQLRVEETCIELPGGRLSFGPPKSERSRRTVSLPGFVVDVLAAHLAGRDLRPDSLVFTRPLDGGPMRRANFRARVWVPACDTAGLVPRPRVHDLRHSHVALLIAEGVHVKRISDRLGHASIKITMDRYGHLLPDGDETVMAALERRHEAGIVGQAVGQNVTKLARSGEAARGSTGR